MNGIRRRSLHRSNVRCDTLSDHGPGERHEPSWDDMDTWRAGRRLHPRNGGRRPGSEDRSGSLLTGPCSRENGTHFAGGSFSCRPATRTTLGSILAVAEAWPRTLSTWAPRWRVEPAARHHCLALAIQRSDSRAAPVRRWSKTPGNSHTPTTMNNAVLVILCLLWSVPRRARIISAGAGRW